MLHPIEIPSSLLELICIQRIVICFDHGQLKKDIQDGFLWFILFVDDVVFISETRKYVIDRLRLRPFEGN